MVTKARLIYSDAVLLFVICGLYFITEHFTKNLLLLALVLLLLGTRSIFLHASWYEKTGKIY